MLWLAVAAGGALGACARHLLNGVVHSRLLATSFPAGIFLVNVLGCAAIGVLAGLLAAQRLEIGEVGRTFLVVGVLGGFTTFSSFGLDTFVLARGPQPALAVLNAAGQTGLGLLALWIGFAVGTWRP